MLSPPLNPKIGPKHSHCDSCEHMLVCSISTWTCTSCLAASSAEHGVIFRFMHDPSNCGPCMSVLQCGHCNGLAPCVAHVSFISSKRRRYTCHGYSNWLRKERHLQHCCCVDCRGDEPQMASVVDGSEYSVYSVLALQQEKDKVVVDPQLIVALSPELAMREFSRLHLHALPEGVESIDDLTLCWFKYHLDASGE